MRIKKSKYLVYLVLMATLVLFACDDGRHLKDLRTYINTLKKSAAQKHQTNPPLNIETPAPAVYQEDNQRSPFDEETAVAQSNATYPLQGYPLNMLRLKGTLVQDNEIWAFIMTPDDNLYRAKIGDTIGNQYGKIVNIFSDRLEVEEPIAKRGKHSMQRIVTLQLKDES